MYDRTRFLPQTYATSALPVIDMSDITPAATPTRRLVRKGTIQAYFKPASPSNNNSSSSDIDAKTCSTTVDMHANLPLQAPEQKKHRITADNGRVLSLRQPEKKKIKREATLECLEEGSQTLHRKKTRAKLANLPHLPLDVLFEVSDVSLSKKVVLTCFILHEVFSHLLPLDILHLVRTTKALRATLLHRSATSVWKASLSNIANLPPCPDDLSLPFYINLLFDSHCHVR